MTPQRNWDPTLSASLEEHSDGKDGVVNALSATCTSCRDALGPRIRRCSVARGRMCDEMIGFEECFSLFFSWPLAAILLL